MASEVVGAFSLLPPPPKILPKNDMIGDRMRIIVTRVSLFGTSCFNSPVTGLFRTKDE